MVVLLTILAASAQVVTPTRTAILARAGILLLQALVPTVIQQPPRPVLAAQPPVLVTNVTPRRLILG